MREICIGMITGELTISVMIISCSHSLSKPDVFSLKFRTKKGKKKKRVKTKSYKLSEMIQTNILNKMLSTTTYRPYTTLYKVLKEHITSSSSFAYYFASQKLLSIKTSSIPISFSFSSTSSSIITSIITLTLSS